MVKILQVLGTRPNITKFINITGKDILAWTGQHYDNSLIKGMPKMDYVSHDVTLDQMIKSLKAVIINESPDIVVLYGDTRSALAGALAANEFGIKIAHIEAGCRLDDMNRPEERIRRMIDHISDYLFCVNEKHRCNLEEERVLGNIFVVGDLHYDKYLENRKHLGYTLVTIHRAEHVDNRKVLKSILGRLKCEKKVVFPIHPRTRKKIKEFKLKVPKNVRLIEPLSYKEMLNVLRWAKLVITDSGGVCREAHFSGTPVETIGKTEWPEIHAFGSGDAGNKIRKILLEVKK